MELVLYNNAKKAVAQLQKFDEIKEHLNKAAAVKEYAKRAKDTKMEIDAAAYRTYCERRAGELLTGTSGQGSVGRGRKVSDERKLTAKDADLRPSAATEYRQLAELEEEEFDEAVSELSSEGVPPTRGKVMEKARPHVANNSGQNEWYTPAEYIEAARLVMGTIDLDPASSEEANAVVGASRFYSASDDGLSSRKIWRGNVWMNPPYSSDLIGAFCDKLVYHVGKGHVKQSIVLVNNATETKWFCNLVSVASSVCFPSSRIRFWGPEGAVGAPLQGQAVIGIGCNKKKFVSAYSEIGWCAHVSV